MKKFAFLGLAMMMLLCSACARDEMYFYEKGAMAPIEPQEEVLEVTVPESYFTYTGSNPQSEALVCKEMGAEYCSDAWAEDGVMILKLTETQLKNFIIRNNEYGEELRSDFLELDENYSFEGSDDYTTITFYCDENVSIMDFVEALSGATAQYALNYILKNNSGDWSIHLKVVNCHTGKVVAEGNLPQDEITINENAWTASYAD